MKYEDGQFELKRREARKVGMSHRRKFPADADLIYLTILNTRFDIKCRNEKIKEDTDLSVYRHNAYVRSNTEGYARVELLLQAADMMLERELPVLLHRHSPDGQSLNNETPRFSN